MVLAIIEVLSPEILIGTARPGDAMDIYLDLGLPSIVGLLNRA